PLIWSLSEPYGARSWWPCKDAPEDKADSVDVRFTVPSALITASNGTLISATDDGVKTVSHWHERHPIATYLISIASYPYMKTLDWYRPSPADSMPIEFYNFPEELAGAAPTQAEVKGMIAAYAARLGPYPFLDEKYGHAQFLFGGGMEHQTCTSLGVFSEYVVAHELGHQWWGDLVTCRNFHHIWLNEGFATYMEALWAEAGGGPAAYHADLSLKRYFGAGTVYVPDTTDAGRIFDYRTTYEKGAWVLHMLRHALGDTVFFQALRQYRTQFAYGTAVTEDFEGVCEAVSGRDLHRFFQQWVYGERYPVYRYSWTATPRPPGVDVTLTLEQTQTWQLFAMPVDVRISTDLGDRTFVADDSLAQQTFTFHVSGTPGALAIDPDEWILRHFDQSVVNPRFDRSVLLVNGASWGYGSALSSAYADKAFSGDYGVDFWDEFDAPAGGYPSGLPPAVGHGEINGDLLGRYRNVVWVTDSYGGDPDWWLPSPLLAYLRGGGNLLLMADEVLATPDDSLLDYAGVGTGTHSSTIQDCVAARPGLVDMPPILGSQIGAVYDTVRTRTDTELLFTAQLGFFPPGALGVIREPAGGAGGRPHGGRMALVSGIPFHWDHAPMRANVTAILSHYFGEPVSGLAAEPPPPGAPALALSTPRPNPFSGGTTTRLTLGMAARVDAEVLDASGRRVRVIASGVFASGEHALAWDGRDAAGRLVPAGVYWLRVRAGGDEVVRKMVRLP
ncbi:MAG: M1 family aminopeptidase, partial [Candidatus Eisenbacteria bacterium]